MLSLSCAPPVRLLFVSLILTVVRATSPAWASGPTSDFRAEIIRTAEGHAEVKWPTRKGGYYTLQYSISLEEIGWTDLFTAYAGSTSSSGNLATFAYLNQDWGTGTFANLPPISTYNCPGGISVTLVVADPLPLPPPQWSARRLR